MSEAVPQVRTIPQPLIVLGCASLGAGVGIGWSLPPSAVWAAPLGIAGGIAVVAASGTRRHRRAMVVGAVLAVLLAAGLLRGASAAGSSAGLAAAVDSPGVIRGTVATSPVAYRGEVLLIVDVDESTSAGSPTGTVAMALLGRSDALPGDRVEVAVSRLRLPDDRPGPLSSAALSRQGVDAVAVAPRLTIVGRGGPSLARAVAHMRGDMSGMVDAVLPEPGASLLDGVAFGIHRPLPTAVSAPLQDAGLAHLEATSGLKVVTVAGLVARLLALAAAGPRLRRVARVAGMGAFVMLAGGGAAAIRSTAMAATGTLLRGGARRAAPLPLLALVAAVMVAVAPRLAGDLGYQLSVLGTLGIIVLADPIAARIPGPRLLAEAFAVAVAAQLVTLPVQVEAFGTLSLIGPLANAVAVPLLPVVIVLGWLGVVLSAVAPGLGAPVLLAAGAAVGVIEAIARVAAALPGAALHPATWPRVWTWALGATVVAGVLVRGTLATDARRTGAAGDTEVRADRRAVERTLRPGVARPNRLVGRGRVALAAGVGVAVVTGAGGAILVASRPDGRLHLSVLDVGAGTAVLVRTSAGALALVDGGPDPAKLVTALGAALPPLTRRLDQLVLTGGERAVTAGLADLTAHYAVTAVVIPDADLGTAARAAVLQVRNTGATVRIVPVGSPWRWGGAEWRCAGEAAPDAVVPVAPVCALQVADAGASALILGDLPAPAQEELAAVDGDGLRSDLVVTPPNGLLAAALAERARPLRLAVPCARAPKVALAHGAERTTADGGTLTYAGGPGGLGLQ